MLSFTLVQESKGVKMRRTYLLAMASAQPPLRWVNVFVIYSSWLSEIVHFV